MYKKMSTCHKSASFWLTREVLTCVLMDTGLTKTAHMLNDGLQRLFWNKGYFGKNKFEKKNNLFSQLQDRNESNPV